MKFMTSVHLPAEVAWHEYFLKIVAAGSEKLLVDFYINFSSLIQPAKLSTTNAVTVLEIEYL